MQNSALLRFVDRYIGLLLCQAAGLFLKTAALFQKKSTAKIPQKVLLIELFEMGAAVMLTPSIKYIQSLNPEVEIHILTTSSCAAIWQVMDGIKTENVHILSGKSALRFLISIVSTVFKLRRFSFDMVIDYELFFRISALLSASMRSCGRAGFMGYGLEGVSRGDFYERHCAFNQNTHIAVNLLSLTKSAFTQDLHEINYKGCIYHDEVLMAPLAQFTEQKLSLKPSIVISPDVGANLSVRNYPTHLLTQSLREIQRLNPECSFIFIGTEENKQLLLQREGAQELLALGQNMMGKTDFIHLLNIIAEAQLLITNDAGPSHFATLTGTKTLALFSTDSPFMYGPLGKAITAYAYYQCSPCISALNHKSTLCQNNLCLQAIPASQVVRLAQALLENTAQFRTINNLTSYLVLPERKAL